jgi:ppGpp synthetase/RelA/SpoT-type nucleotidyltranferase
VRITATRWFGSYLRDYEEYKAAARLAEDLIREALDNTVLQINGITSRAKTPASTRHKIEENNLGLPARQLKDLLGVRVTTTFAHDVDQVVDALEQLFRTESRVDKRGLLDLHQFGYRSVHLIVRIPRSGRIGAAAERLEGTPIEIQVRSVIEHAWAEIEHDLRYKSGVHLPDDLTRRFSALAGALELVDREFDALHLAITRNVMDLRAAYEAGSPGGASLDSARLLGLIMARRPQAPINGPSGLVMSLPDANRLVRLCKQVGVDTDLQLSGFLAGQELLGFVRDYAESQGVEPQAASAQAVLSLVVLVEARRIGLSLRVTDDPALLSVLEP